jgi:hypothetical protein
MYALLSLVVCLAGQPAICETVTPDLVHPDTGQPPTLFECLGVGGQESRAAGWTSTRAIFCVGFSAPARAIPIACASGSKPRAPEPSGNPGMRGP